MTATVHGLPQTHILTKGQFLRGFVPPDYLIDGVIQRRYIYSFTGQTGDGKTAIALHIAQQVGKANSSGAMLGSHRVEPGRVLYFAGENPDDLRMRVLADDEISGHDGARDRIHFVPGVHDLSEMRSILDVEARKLGGFDLVVIDTSAAYFLGDDEISNTQMGQHARMLRGFTEMPGSPCVIVLCHPTKNAREQTELSPRGGGSFLAEMDGNLTGCKKDGYVELWHTKMRGPGFEPITFRLEKITSPSLLDSKQRPLPTVRAVPMTEVEQQSAASQERSDEDRLMIAMLSKNNQSIAQLATACGWLANGKAYKSKVSRLLERLKKDYLVEKYRDDWRLTKAGKDAASKAAGSMKVSDIP